MWTNNVERKRSLRRDNYYEIRAITWWFFDLSRHAVINSIQLIIIRRANYKHFLLSEFFQMSNIVKVQTRILETIPEIWGQCIVIRKLIVNLWPRATTRAKVLCICHLYSTYFPFFYITSVVVCRNMSYRVYTKLSVFEMLSANTRTMFHDETSRYGFVLFRHSRIWCHR